MLVFLWAHHAPAQETMEGKGDGAGTPSGFKGVAVGAACLINQTHYRVNYGISWGDGPWENFSLDPGALWVHWWNFNPAAVAASDYRHPSLRVNFDNDLSDGVNYRNYYLVPYVAQKPDCDASNRYVFRYSDASHRWFDLYDVH
jgi:hypothetical protein